MKPKAVNRKSCAKSKRNVSSRLIRQRKASGMSKTVQNALIAVLVVVAILVVGAVINLLMSQQNEQRIQEINAILEAAKAYADNGEYEAAINEYDRALEFVSDNFNIYLNRGTAYAELGNF